MSLGAMQKALEVQDKCTYILVKLKEGSDVDAVAAQINQEVSYDSDNSLAHRFIQELAEIRLLVKPEVQIQ